MPPALSDSTGHEPSKPVFNTSLDPAGLHLSTLSPSTRPTIINRRYVLAPLRLWPRRHPIKQDLFQRPHMISQARRHRWCNPSRSPNTQARR
ncbi:hypothetical protein [Candidatus Entotheonella palauensis]|uniref:hypothetical protein n=1 Tax=Candidatus Entotheonella palauensis TaxID=93172 RepID=UPI0011788B40|nr:hypothetical protein [Candidatus Entotheonella palauensis]